VVDGGQSLSREAPLVLATLPDERERAFAQACVYGVLRDYQALQADLSRFLQRPLRERDFDVTATLLCALYQMRQMRVPAHAAVSASVEALREIGKPWACKLANGVLRSAQRAGAPPAATDAAAEHPAWLVNATRDAWPERWVEVLCANNRQAPLCLRVNTLRANRDACLARLADAGIAAHPGRNAPTAITLDAARAVDRLPGFDSGEVSVQDEAAQLAALLLDPQPHERVLDACAAPGGKTAHLIEHAGGQLELVALDQAADRLEDVRVNLSRLGLSAELAAVDAAATADWWDGRPFDRILLDAPCSAVGVIRRHPDIRFHRRADDLVTLAATQARLLAALWPLLASGGTLLYVTCSYLPAENDEVIAAFLAATTDALALDIEVEWGRPTAHGRQVLPGEDDMDGFYFALLGKRTAAITT
jgi:16S rRNA (cytosine967-C5)-methyltransferase